MARRNAAVAADEQVPSSLGGDEAEVFALGLGAFAGAAAYGALQLVGGANPFVTCFDSNRESGRILNSVPTPGGPHTTLHRPHGLAVRMATLEAGGDQLL